MGIEIRLADETPAGRFVREFLLEVATRRMTARDLIRSRVIAEVTRFNETPRALLFQGLVAPTGAELESNGFRLKKHRQLDAEAQVKKATESFERNGFLVLVNEKQVEHLDEILELLPDSKIAFVKLVPLVGG